MLTGVLVVCAMAFTLLAAGAWIGLAEYVMKAMLGHAAVGRVIRLDQDPVYCRKKIPIVQFDTEAGPVEVACDGGWTGGPFLRVGNEYPVRFLRDPARAVVVDLSEFLQQVVGVVLASSLALGFLGWVWFRWQVTV